MEQETLEEKCRRAQGEQDRVLPEKGWIIFHLDGRGFSNYVKRMKFTRPFDPVFSQAMISTAIELAKNIGNTVVAYTQSDEITVICSDLKENRDTWFGNRVWKLSSVAASIATGTFEREATRLRMEDASANWIVEHDGESIPGTELTKIMLDHDLPQFDCKVWWVPDVEDVYSWLSFRNSDCIRNSVLQYAQSMYSHSQLLGKDTDQVRELLKSVNRPWENLGSGLKYGTLIIRREQEIITPNGTATRNRWISMPGFPFSGKDQIMPYLDI